MTPLPAWLREWFSKSRFHNQITLISTIGLLALALTFALVSSEFLSRSLERFSLEVLGQLTGKLAQESWIIFLGSADLAAERIVQIAAFPGVSKVAVLKPNREIWVTSNHTDHWLSLKLSAIEQDRSAFVQDDLYEWYFSAPMHLETDATPLATPHESQLLGYLVVAWRKEPLRQLQSGLFALNGIIALFLAIGINIGFQYFLRRLTDPLDRLSQAIQQLRQGEMNTRAAIIGPAETREMAHMFNALLEEIEQRRLESEHYQEKLQQQHRELESLVAIRTQDLQIARDAALTAVRYKSEFMAAITHEMRMPLQSILGYTKEGQRALFFLEEDADPVIVSHLSNYLETVHNASNDLLMRINQVLDLAAFESHKQEIKLEKIDILTLLEEIVALLKPLSERNDNLIEMRFDGLRQARLDPDKTRQIIRNLLDNACKFTYAGLILLEVTCSQDELVIEVVDNGVGIPPNLLQLIFKPFWQADMSDSRRYGGTGLGLAITHNLCQLMDGDIAVESTLGLGSSFRVTIPLPIILSGRQVVPGFRALDVK